MSIETIKRGAFAGMVGGVVMAMWSMLAMWVDGDGFFTPVNLIAHTLWRDAPLDEAFSSGALVLGMVVHMMMSMMLGAALASVIARVNTLHQNLVTRLAAGMGFGLMVWLVMQFAGWPIVDSDAADGFTAWIFAIGHVMFGLATAFTLYATSNVIARHGAHGPHGASA